MTTKPHFREATQQDASLLAELIILAGGGIVDFLLHDLIPHLTINQLLQTEIQNEQSELFYKNSMVATNDGEVVGAALAYPISKFHKPDDDFIPCDRIEHLKDFYEKKVPHSFYLHCLAVLPNARNKGIAQELVNKVIEKAKRDNINIISLDVWRDNKNAIKLYKKIGFKTVDEINVKKHPLLPHEGGMLSMSLDLTR